MKEGVKLSNLGNKEIMAANIKYYLYINGLSQSDLCRTLGIKINTFSDWVNAKTYPRIDKIELMANYFGIEKSDLVEEKAKIKDKIIEESLNILKELSPEAKEIALEQLRSLSRLSKKSNN